MPWVETSPNSCCRTTKSPGNKKLRIWRRPSLMVLERKAQPEYSVNSLALVWFSRTSAPPASTARLSVRKPSMKSSTSGFTAVKAPVLRNLQSWHVGGQTWAGRVAFMVAQFSSIHIWRQHHNAQGGAAVTSMSFDIVQPPCAPYIGPHL